MDGKSPSAQLEAIRSAVTELVCRAYACFRDQLMPELDRAHIRIVDYSVLNDQQREHIENYFLQTVFPVLTPLAFDPGRPFPHMSNLSHNLAVLVRDQSGEKRFARVKVPGAPLPRLVPVPAPDGAAAEQGEDAGKAPQQWFTWLEQVIAANLQSLFPGMEVLESHPFRVTRDAELAIQELEADDLLETIERFVRRRRFGSVIRVT